MENFQFLTPLLITGVFKKHSKDLKLRLNRVFFWTPCRKFYNFFKPPPSVTSCVEMRHVEEMRGGSLAVLMVSGTITPSGELDCKKIFESC